MLLARDLKWLDKLDVIFGLHTDVDGMVAMINAPAGIFNVLSVGLFAARFILNAGIILKHTLFPVEGEDAVSMGSRWSNAFNERFCTMLNDVAWGSVNGLCNYSEYFNLSAAFAGWLTAGFLVFDVALLLYRRKLAYEDYLLKREQYEFEKGQFKAAFEAGKLTPIEMKRYNMLDDQLTELQIEWETLSVTYLFNVAAASLLMAGFSASLLLATSAMSVAVCYILCTVAVAMYLSADSYGAYHEATLKLQQCEWESLQNRKAGFADAVLDKRLHQLQDKSVAARNDFIMSMIKNTVMPLLIVTTLAASLQAGLILAVAYIGYECTRGYFDRPPNEDLENTCTDLVPVGC